MFVILHLEDNWTLRVSCGFQGSYYRGGASDIFEIPLEREQYDREVCSLMAGMANSCF